MIDTRGLIPVVIGCTGGSGSRAVRDLLDCIPVVYMDRDTSDNSKDSQGSLPFLAMAGAPFEEIAPYIETFLVQLLARIPPDREPSLRYLGWKNPRNLRVIDDLFALHPELRFIHLVRDPSALARGGQAKKGWKRRRARGEVNEGETRDSQALQRWVEYNLPAWQRWRDNPRYFLLHYEKLCNEPVATVDALTAWLGIESWPRDEVLAVIDPPADNATRGSDVDVSSIQEAAAIFGYA